MKTPILLIAVLGYTCASPNGYYHTEYNYKTSQSSFRNNELEHKTDDQGYYKKDGDLENRYKPIEDSNSEHSEYVNPKFQNAGYDYNRDTNSYGHMRAGAYGSANNQEVEDLAHSNRIYGSQSGYGAAAGSSYGSYSMGSSLRTVTARLQQQLEREIQDMIRYNLQSHSRLDLAQLERELRQNLTDRLDNELNVKYGQQLIRSGKSYSMIGGRLEPTANYDHQELVDLKNQLENVLLSQLRSQYNQYSTSQYSYSNTNTNTNANNYAYAYTTTQKPYYSTVSYRPIYPTLSTPRYVDYTHNGYNSVKTRYTPIANPESLTVIASRVQSQLDANLNNVLDETRRTHFSSSQQYSLTNPEILLERLRTELRNNITYQLDDIIRQNYGSQTQKDGYLYSVGPSGALSSDSNYSLRDLENLKEQIERNLVNKLNRDFESFSKSWSSSSSYRSQSSYGTNYGTGTGTYGTGTYGTGTGTYGTGTGTGTYGTSAGIGTYGTGTRTGTYGAGTYGTGTLGIGTSNYGTTSNPTYYQPGIKTNEYGSSASAHNTYVAQSSGNMAELQRQLQADLSRQLNLAVNRESAGSYTYNPQTYQTSLQELSNQLNRNLTRHLQEYSASGSYAAQGNFNSAQMADLRTRLEQNLMSQLREGLERSMQTHSSYSSSSSSSSMGNYRNGYESGGCCQGDDPTVYRRFKRSYGHFDQELGQEQEDLGQQQIEETEWTPWERDSHISEPKHTPQRTYHTVIHNTQQKPLHIGWRSRNHNYGSPYQSRSKLQVDQSQEEMGQQQEQIEYVNMGGQVEDNGYHRTTHGKLQLGSLQQQQEDLGQQQLEDLDYSPQVQVNRFHKVTHGKIISNTDQEQQDLGQQQEEVDYIPQVQVNRYYKVTHGKIISNVDQEQQDLGQQQEEDELGYAPQVQVNRYHKVTRGKIISNADQEQQDLGQQQEEDELGYPSQVQVSRYHKVSHGKLLSNPDQEQQDLGQQQEVDELSYAPQEQVNRYHKVIHGKIISNADQEQQDLGQQQEEDESGYPSQVQVSRYHKISHGKLLSNPDQEQQDLGQQQEVDELSYAPQEQVNRYRKVTRGKIISNDDQEQQDLGQQQEEDELGYPSQVRVNRYHKVTRGKLQLNNIDSQQQENLGQQQEEDELGHAPQVQMNSYHKFTRGKLQLNNVDSQQQENLGQQQDDALEQAPQVNSYHKFTRGKLQLNNVDSQQQEDLSQQQQVVENLGQQVEEIRLHKIPGGSLQHVDNVEQQQEEVGQQQIVDNDDMSQQVEETLISKNNHGILHNTDQEQQNLGQKQVGDIDLDQQQVEEIGFHKVTQGKLQSSIWDETPQINLGIQKKPIDIGQEHVNQYPVPNELGDSKIEQVPDTGEDLTQQVEKVDINAVMGANDLPDDISKKTESIQQSLSKKLEIAIIGFCGTDKLNVAHMREKLTEEIKKNVTEEFNKEETKDYLEHDLHLNSGQILKFQTLILEKLFAKLEAGIEFAKRRHEEQTTSNVSVINEPELSDFTTTEETQQPDISTVLQNDTEGNTVFTQTTRNRTVIISHTQHSNSKVGVTDQGQFITIPQTKVEAENEADSLISILRSYIQKEVERNDVPLKTAVKTFVTNNTDDNGGKHYTRTTIYRGGNENIGQSYTRTVSTSSYSSTGSKPLHDGYQGSTQQEIIGGSILHRNPQTQHSHYGHVDFNSDILPHQGSIYSETELSVSPQYSGYNKKIEETFSSPLEHHHNYGSYGKHQQETDWHKITGENLHHSFHLGQQDEIGGFQRPTTHSLHQVISAGNLGQEQVEETGFPKLTHGKVHSNFGQHVDDFQQQDLGQQQQQDLGFGLEQVDRKIKFGQEQVEEPDLVQQQVEISVLPKFTNGKLHHGDQQNEDLDQQQQEQIEESISHKLTQGKLGYQKQQHISQQEVVDPNFDQAREIVYNKGSQGKLEVIPVQHQQEIEQVPQVLTDDLNSHNVHVDDEVKDPKTNGEHLTFWQKVTQTVHNGADVIKQQATVLKQKAKDLKEKVHDGTDLIKQKAKELKEKVIG